MKLTKIIWKSNSGFPSFLPFRIIWHSPVLEKAKQPQNITLHISFCCPPLTWGYQQFLCLLIIEGPVYSLRGQGGYFQASSPWKERSQFLVDCLLSHAKNLLKYHPLLYVMGPIVLTYKRCWASADSRVRWPFRQCRTWLGVPERSALFEGGRKAEGDKRVLSLVIVENWIRDMVNCVLARI